MCPFAAHRPYGRGENAVRHRRKELTKVVYLKIEQSEKDRSCKSNGQRLTTGSVASAGDEGPKFCPCSASGGLTVSMDLELVGWGGRNAPNALLVLVSAGTCPLAGWLPLSRRPKPRHLQPCLLGTRSTTTTQMAKMSTMLERKFSIFPPAVFL